MNSNQKLSGIVTHSCLPDDLLICYRLHPKLESHTDIAALQNRSGSELTEKMIRHYRPGSEVEVITQKNEKPRAFADREEVSVSFSHTETAAVSVISSVHTVGCDMEIQSRKVHPRLIERIKHPDEKTSLYEACEAVQIWTFKEAMLKMIGTGLRKPMNSVCVVKLDESRFEVEMDDGNRAKICSFSHKGHWISVCYR